MEEDEEGQSGRRIAKRARRNKSLVVGFDEAARQNFVTGFRSRKNKRRKVAEEQNKEKARQRKLLARKEIRATRKEMLGLAPAADQANSDDVPPATTEDETETVVYEHDGVKTIVTTRPFKDEDADDDHKEVVDIQAAASKQKNSRLLMHKKKALKTKKSRQRL